MRLIVDGFPQLTRESAKLYTHAAVLTHHDDKLGVCFSTSEALAHKAGKLWLGRGAKSYVVRPVVQS